MHDDDIAVMHAQAVGTGSTQLYMLVISPLGGVFMGPVAQPDLRLAYHPGADKTLFMQSASLSHELAVQVRGSHQGGVREVVLKRMRYDQAILILD